MKEEKQIYGEPEMEIVGMIRYEDVITLSSPEDTLKDPDSEDYNDILGGLEP